MFTLKEILEKTACSDLSVEEAEKLVRLQAIVELEGIAKLDYKREERKGVPEVILAENKSVGDTVDIAVKMFEASGRVIISRCTVQHVEALRAAVVSKLSDAVCSVNERARVVVIKRKDYPVVCSGGRVGLLTAGTSDISVAEEVRVISEEMGCMVYVRYDLGVAGIHRLLDPLKELVVKDVDVIVVVAGREGALPSVVAGMVNVPVIAVPTSNSYGFGGKGVGTLMAMLQSCSLGMSVVNIDSGISAGAMATLIANRVAKFRKG
jgi:NCAIR mutase (PurE)-related protein